MSDSKTYRGRTSRNEFSNRVREEARAALRAMFHRELESEADPVMELITCLLEDGAGGILPLSEPAVTTEQWLIWNRLVTERPKAVTRTLTREQERERPELPEETEAMRRWAARLLLSTLDRLGML